MQETKDILVIGNDATSVSEMTRVLASNGYRTTLAASAEAITQACCNRLFTLALINNDNLHLARDLAEASPDTACILLADTPARTDTSQQNIIAVLPSPVDTDLLLGIIHQKIGQKSVLQLATGPSGKTELSLVDSKELDNMKSKLLSTVSHELRTPLASIKGYASMILDYEDRMKPLARRESLNAIVRACDRLVDLIDQLIDLSRFEAGLIKINRIPSSLRHIINTVVEEVQQQNPDYRFRKAIKGIPAQMDLDARRIRQVFDNLLDNAVKYSPPGSDITLGAQAENDDVLVWIKDEGYGLPEEEKERIFNSLYRFKDYLKDDPGGLGLGLSLCKNLVESHSGRIWVESNPDKGCTFFFTLPRK